MQRQTESLKRLGRAGIGWLILKGGEKTMSYTKDNLTVVFADFFPIRAGEAKEKIQRMIEQIRLAEYRYNKTVKN